MNKMCIASLGALLLALYLSSQVQAQNTTMAPNATMAMTTYTMAYNMTTASNSTGNGCGRTEAFTLLLPLTLAASLLHVWS